LVSRARLPARFCRIRCQLVSLHEPAARSTWQSIGDAEFASLAVVRLLQGVNIWAAY